MKDLEKMELNLGFQKRISLKVLQLRNRQLSLPFQFQILFQNHCLNLLFLNLMTILILLDLLLLIVLDHPIHHLLLPPLNLELQNLRLLSYELRLRRHLMMRIERCKAVKRESLKRRHGKQ